MRIIKKAGKKTMEIAIRNPLIVPSRRRKAGTIENKQKGGAKNWQRLYKDEDES